MAARRPAPSPTARRSRMVGAAVRALVRAGRSATRRACWRTHGRTGVTSTQCGAAGRTTCGPSRTAASCITSTARHGRRLAPDVCRDDERVGDRAERRLGGRSRLLRSSASGRLSLRRPRVVSVLPERPGRAGPARQHPLGRRAEGRMARRRVRRDCPWGRPALDAADEPRDESNPPYRRHLADRRVGRAATHRGRAGGSPSLRRQRVPPRPGTRSGRSRCSGRLLRRIPGCSSTTAGLGSSPGASSAFDYYGAAWTRTDTLSIAAASMWGSGPRSIRAAGHQADAAGPCTARSRTTTERSGLSRCSIPMIAGTPNPRRIWGSSPNDVWVSDWEAKTLVHFDGIAWKTLPQTVTTRADLTGIGAASPTDLWAVGDSYQTPRGVVLHGDGRAWEKRDVGSVAGLSALHGSAARVSGPPATKERLHGDGATWTASPRPARPMPRCARLDERAKRRLGRRLPARRQLQTPIGRDSFRRCRVDDRDAAGVRPHPEHLGERCERRLVVRRGREQESRVPQYGYGMGPGRTDRDWHVRQRPGLGKRTARRVDRNAALRRRDLDGRASDFHVGLLATWGVAQRTRGH